MKSRTVEPGQEFLSEEDLDLERLSWNELLAVWNLWLKQAQSSNEADRYTYEHGVFTREPVPAGHAEESRIMAWP